MKSLIDGEFVLLFIKSRGTPEASLMYVILVCVITRAPSISVDAKQSDEILKETGLSDCPNILSPSVVVNKIVLLPHQHPLIIE